jgi:hypothetical protein
MKSLNIALFLFRPKENVKSRAIVMIVEHKGSLYTAFPTNEHVKSHTTVMIVERGEHVHSIAN